MKDLDAVTREDRINGLINDFVENGGFTAEQARFLINLLNDFIPLI